MKMKNILLSIACVFVIFAFAQAQESAPQRDLGANLEVSTSIHGEQKICLLAGGVSSGFILSAKFTNIGKYPVIISKNSGLVSNPLISHTEKESSAEEYEYKLNMIQGDFGTPQFVEKQGELPSATFVTLKPKETYEHDIQGYLRFSLEEYEHYAKSDHFIRFAMITVHGILYYEAQDGSERMEPEVLRARWIKHGYLWFSIVSQPMRIQFPPSANLNECQPTARHNNSLNRTRNYVTFHPLR